MQVQIAKDFNISIVKSLKVIGCFAGISIIVGTLTLTFVTSRPQSLPIRYKLIRNNHTFYLEYATSLTQIKKGLKYRSHLERDRGMLFNLGREVKNAGFWMYKVKIPLDIIFLYQGSVTKVVHNALPCPQQPCLIYTAPVATHVLELPSGSAKLTNIKISEKLNFSEQQ
ncbi:DUF192 domain-containing protein [Nostoc parmelioides]|uniref:DUF192 domain-containing protein n=1 Tax=Nostoc parmelioides FACHB-3921 TaxID=2692909 RepID=A0ABR8BNA8_9NOSO|nr:DUF192 domain-containing protein [Nostoc parmelioides]MBD2254722.1 DUF192 domain-containing protein [Nostoc parmelioides FACHB-3921]